MLAQYQGTKNDSSNFFAKFFVCSLRVYLVFRVGPLNLPNTSPLRSEGTLLGRMRCNYLLKCLIYHCYQLFVSLTYNTLHHFVFPSLAFIHLPFSFLPFSYPTQSIHFFFFLAPLPQSVPFINTFWLYISEPFLSFFPVSFHLSSISMHSFPISVPFLSSSSSPSFSPSRNYSSID